MNGLQTSTPRDVVRSWKLWFELAQTLRTQANYMVNISDAIRANNVDDTKAALTALVVFVKTKQPIFERLSPAINELIHELFEEGE